MYKYNLVNKPQELAHSLRNNLGPADLGSLGIWLFVVKSWKRNLVLYDDGYYEIIRFRDGSVFVDFVGTSHP